VSSITPCYTKERLTSFRESQQLTSKTITGCSIWCRRWRWRTRSYSGWRREDQGHLITVYLKLKGFIEKTEQVFCQPCTVKEQEVIDTNCSTRPSSWIH